MSFSRRSSVKEVLFLREIFSVSFFVTLLFFTPIILTSSIIGFSTTLMVITLFKIEISMSLKKLELYKFFKVSFKLLSL